jgi:hypothetical protein
MRRSPVCMSFARRLRGEVGYLKQLRSESSFAARPAVRLARNLMMAVHRIALKGTTVAHMVVPGRGLPRDQAVEHLRPKPAPGRWLLGRSCEGRP